MENDFTELQKLIRQCNKAYDEQIPPREEITEDEEIKLNFERFLNVISYLETLEKYMKIEQDIGISLEVLFKALKDGIVMDDEEYQTFLMYDEVTNSYCFKCGKIEELVNCGTKDN